MYDEEYAAALEESGGDEDYAELPENAPLPDPGRRPLDRHPSARPANVGKAIQDAMREIETANPDTLYGVFGDAPWTNKDRLPDQR